jgi:hypothetical protein
MESDGTRRMKKRKRVSISLEEGLEKMGERRKRTYRLCSLPCSSRRAKERDT